MKKIISEQAKNFKYILGYWVVCIIIPFLVMLFIMNMSHGQSTVMGPVLLYIIFISPFLYFIPYLLAKPKYGFSFIVFGLIIPLAIMYLTFYLIFINNFHAFEGVSLF